MNDFIFIQGAVNPIACQLLEKYLRTQVMDEKPNQVIQRNGSPYINRWMLSRKAIVPVYDDPALALDTYGMKLSMLENLYLHEYARPDADDPHCHPWANATLVVHGWYTENVYEDGGNRLINTVTRYAGDIVLRNDTSVHAIVDTSPGCLSLFATSKKTKPWGFHTDDGFKTYDEYHVNTAGMPIGF